MQSGPGPSTKEFGEGVHPYLGREEVRHHQVTHYLFHNQREVPAAAFPSVMKTSTSSTLITERCVQRAAYTSSIHRGSDSMMLAKASLN